MANPATTYVQNEQKYLYCNVCGRKEYNLRLVNQTASDNNHFGNFVNGKWVAQTIYCNRYNSAPYKYPVLQSGSTPTQAKDVLIGTGYCQGTMTLTTQTLSQLDNQSQLNERTSS